MALQVLQYTAAKNQIECSLQSINSKINKDSFACQSIKGDFSYNKQFQILKNIINDQSIVELS